MKIALFGLSIALSMLLSSPVFAGSKAGDKKAGEHDCCASKATQSDVACIDYGSLHLTADQKSKIEAWQGECLKAGCTNESRHTFLKHAKTVLSPDQFAKLKEQCKTPKAS
jgi:hypothetical protein